MREIGVVKAVQIQRSSLKSGVKPQQVYAPTALLAVARLQLSPEGVLGLTDTGETIVDVHHAQHAETKNVGKNGVSVGFTSHYAAMRARFGPHLVDGSAGENILVDAEQSFALADLGGRLIFQNTAGEEVVLEKLLVDAPCEPFSRFALQQTPPVEASLMKSTLQFLDSGMRGFYATAQRGSVQVGDKVYSDVT